MTTPRITVLLTAAALALTACEKKPATPPTRPVTPTTPTPAPAPKAPPVTPPASPTPPAPAGPAVTPPATPAPGGAPAGAGVIKVGDLNMPLPAGWKEVPPANPMRLAEVQVPDASGDPAKGCTIAFSTAGGDVLSNIDRWAGQVRDASNQPAKPTVDTRTINGLTVHTAQMTGSYANMGETTPHQNWSLRGAIVETEGGLLFIKMTGPAEQVAAAGPGFDTMINGMKK